jgi:uncharacterized protein (DUF779 family)
MDDSPEYEKFNIIDRAGQQLTFKSPVIGADDDHNPVNDHNMARRRDQLAEKGTQLSMSKIKGKVAEILVMDLLQQKFQLRADATGIGDGATVTASGLGGSVHIRQSGGAQSGGGTKGSDLKARSAQEAYMLLDYGVHLEDKNASLSSNDSFDMHDGRGQWKHVKKILIQVSSGGGSGAKIEMTPESIFITAPNITIAADNTLALSGKLVTVSGELIKLN